MAISTESVTFLLRGVCVAALLALFGMPVRAAEVTIPDGDVSLRGVLHAPEGAPVAPGIVALHGCGGPWARRDGQWAKLLTEAGHEVVFPDSFGSRGLGSQCKVTGRTIRPGRERRADTVAAASWLAAQPGVGPGLVVLGWSNGGSTVLAAAAEGVMPAGLVRGFVAFYPGCRLFADRASWAPSAPLLILMGADDDWTPAEPCRRLAARYPDKITLVTYPGTYHDFDVPGLKVRVREGLAYTAQGGGHAHTGSNPAAREDAIARVLAFLKDK